MIPTLITLISLTMSALVGLAPLHVTARVQVDSSIQRATACLVWTHGRESNRDCWAVDGLADRTWVKPLLLTKAGEWVVSTTLDGVDKDNRPISIHTPALIVTVE